jgi:hypothetical protein
MKGKSIEVFWNFLFRYLSHNPIFSLMLSFYGSIRKLSQLAGWEEELNQIYSEIHSK